MEVSSTILTNVFDELVASMRETGVIGSVVETDGISVMQSVNALSENEVVVINGADYTVFNVSTIGFSVEGTGLSGSWVSQSPYYDYGHLKEISNKLIKMDTETAPYSYKKYPLIALVTDIEIDEGDPIVEGIVRNLFLVIINNTQEEYSSKERYENNIIPILYPLFEELKKKIKSSKYFIGVYPKINLKRKEMPFWGSTSKYGNIKNITNDPLDAIQIRITELKIDSKKCII